jgi:hypothetical protein
VKIRDKTSRGKRKGGKEEEEKMFEGITYNRRGEGDRRQKNRRR